MVCWCERKRVLCFCIGKSCVWIWHAAAADRRQESNQTHAQLQQQIHLIIIYTRHSASSCKLRNNKIPTLYEQVFVFCVPLISSSINQSKSKNRVCNVTKEALHTVSCRELFFFVRVRRIEKRKKNKWKGTWYTCYLLLFALSFRMFVCICQSAKNRNWIEICVNTTRNTLITRRIIFYWEHLMFCFFSFIFWCDYGDFSYELVEQ